MLNDAGFEKEIEKLLNKKDEHLMNCITLGVFPKRGNSSKKYKNLKDITEYIL